MRNLIKLISLYNYCKVILLRRRFGGENEMIGGSNGWRLEKEEKSYAYVYIGKI